MDKKVNERQIRHLIEAMNQSGYYFRKKEGKPKLDLKFIEALQVLFLDSKGKNVRRTINAFRTICLETFKGLPEVDFMSYEIRKRVFKFLKKNMKPKAYKRVKKFLNEGPKISVSPVSTDHPQKRRGTIDFDYSLNFFSEDYSEQLSQIGR